MSSSAPGSASAQQLINQARTAAAHAAQRAEVEVRTLRTPRDAAAAADLLNEIWNSDGKGAPPLETSLIIALEHGGNYVATAYRDDHMVGVAAGFCGPPQTTMMHSHVAGVSASAKGKGVGTALKLHQRSWCLEHGITTMEWTFDPLIRRNAYFNLQRLGVQLVEYLPQFYGEMTDGINAGQGSDRALVRWNLTETAMSSTDAAAPQNLPVLLGVGAGQEPVLSSDIDQVLDGTYEHLGLRIPADVEQLRTDRPELSALWRTALRQGMHPLMQAGWTISGITSEGTYLLHRPAEST